jgi:hypothetical protein
LASESFSKKKKGLLGASNKPYCFHKLVAGVRFELTTFGL